MGVALRTCLPLAAMALGGCGLLQQWRPATVEEYTPVFERASAGDVVAVRAALDHDPRLVRARETDRATLLHDAAGEGQVGVAALLISRGARVDARTEGGLTPLHLAAQNGDLPMMELLVRSGAKVNAADAQGRTPADHAGLHRHGDAAAWLSLHGGRPGRASSDIVRRL